MMNTTLWHHTESQKGDLATAPIEYIFIIACAVSSLPIIACTALYVVELFGLCSYKGFVKLETESTTPSEKLNSVQAWGHVLDPGSCTGGRRGYGAILFTLIILFYITAVGGESSLQRFTFSFAVKSQLNFTVDEATYLNSGFSFSFSVGRLMGAVISKFLHPQNVLHIACAGSAMSSTLFILWGCSKRVMAWFSILSFGLFVAPLFANGFNWADRYLVMTPFAGGIPFVACNVGSIIYGYAQGYLFEHYGVIALPWMCVVFAVSMVLLDVLMQVATCGRQDRFSSKMFYKMNSNPLIQEIELTETQGVRTESLTNK